MQIYPLSNRLGGELSTRWPDYQASAMRRAIAKRKRTIYEGDHLDLVKATIADLMPGAPDMPYVQRFASRFPNVLKAVTDSVAVCNNGKTFRSLRGADEKTAKAFATLVDESGIDKKAAGINASSWVYGPTMVSPRIDLRNRLALDIMPPDVVDVKRSGDYIEAVLWLYEGTYIEINQAEFRYYDIDGTLTQVVPHSTGVCPAVPFISMDNTSSFWTPASTLGLADATLMIGYRLAHMLYVRQVSGNKLITTHGDMDNIPAGQSLGTHTTSVHFTGQKGLEGLEVHDRVVSAKDHIEEIAVLLSYAVADAGLPPNTVGVSSGQNALEIKVDGDRLTLIRNRQVKWLLASEREFWPMVCDYVNASSHKLAGKLPPSDEAREMLRVEYPDLASYEDQLLGIEALKAGLPLGISNPRDFLAGRRPELTESEIEEEMHENLALYIDVIEPLTTRQTPADPAQAAKGYQTVTQEQGRQGGISSGKARQPDVANAA